MGIKNVFIHLGMPKAGSSSIQNTLYNNAAFLEENGFKYLTEWGQNHFKKFDRLFSEYPDFPFGTGFLGKAIYRKKNKKDINKLLKVINNSNCENLILSGEYCLSFYQDFVIENLKDFIKLYFHDNGIKTTIIYYIRNPLSWIISWMQQTIYTNGYRNKNWNFFEKRIIEYNGIFNLYSHFTDSIKIIKFEDACLDKEGFVASLLKTIGFPENKISNIDMYRANESKSMEVMELMHFIEAAQPRYPNINSKKYNSNRRQGDLKSLQRINGIKYDLPLCGKIDLWNSLQETVLNLKEKLDIDYTGYKPSSLNNQELYSEETIQGFIDAFPKLNLILKKHFLNFFEKKYMETAQEKFKKLHSRESVPYKIYNKNYSFFKVFYTKINNKLYSVKKTKDKFIK